MNFYVVLKAGNATKLKFSSSNTCLLEKHEFEQAALEDTKNFLARFVSLDES